MTLNYSTNNKQTEHPINNCENKIKKNDALFGSWNSKFTKVKDVMLTN